MSRPTFSLPAMKAIVCLRDGETVHRTSKGRFFTLHPSGDYFPHTIPGSAVRELIEKGIIGEDLAVIALP